MPKLKKIRRKKVKCVFSRIYAQFGFYKDPQKIARGSL